MKRLTLLLCSLAFSQAAFAEEWLFTGQVQSITLQPSGLGQCKRACADTPPGSVCISNEGGCQDAVLKIVEDHLGSRTGETVHFASRTGEWGKLNFPNDDALILVYAKDGHTTWAPLTTRDGKAYFKASAMHGEIRTKLQMLTQDADGEAELDQLIAALHR